MLDSIVQWIQRDELKCCNRQTIRSVTLESNELVTAEIVDAFMQRLLWDKDIINAEGQPADLFRVKVNLFKKKISFLCFSFFPSCN